MERHEAENMVLAQVMPELTPERRRKKLEAMRQLSAAPLKPGAALDEKDPNYPAAKAVLNLMFSSENVCDHVDRAVDLLLAQAAGER